ncbi:uncharacterized protein LOC141627671 [Silene latifolia]|uniref:uncharacterized protein LOC141627671 n=1 Tax=Silene latifolia TaxID=37657 RepID=UPI003D77607A
MGKYIWWIMQKKDHLWVKWVHSIYIKQSDWASYTPNSGASWSWRSICRCKDIFISGYTRIWWQDEDGNYTIAKGYKWLRGDQPEVSWHSWIWNCISLPKHRFIAWLAIRQRLLTKNKLCMMIGCSEDWCDLCGTAKEDHAHLFFQCPYSHMCIQLISDWCEVLLPTANLVDWWSNQSFGSQEKKDIVAAIVVAAMYQIWWMRNHCRLEKKIFRPEYVLHRVKEVVRKRCISQCRDNISIAGLIA